jgi:DNA-binding protein YbaB
MAFDPLPSPGSFTASLLDIERRLANLDTSLRALRFPASSADGNLNVTADGLVEVASVQIKPAAPAVVTPDLAALAASLLALANQAFTAAGARAAADTATTTSAFNLLNLCVPNGPMPNFAGFQDAAAALIAEEPAIAQRIGALVFTGTSGTVSATVDGTLRVTSLTIGALPDFLPALEQDVAIAINRARFGARDGIDRRIRDNVDSVPGNAVTLLNTCLYARGALHVDDRVKVVKQDGTFATIVNAGGSGDTNVGADAKVGDVFSRAPVMLRDRSQVNGSVKTNATITRQTNTVVTGAVVENGFIQVPNLSFSVTFPTSNQGPLDLQPTTPVTVKTISPGAWSSVSIKNTATLQVSTGTYFFDSLGVESGGKLSLDSKAGQVIIHVRNGFTFRGTLVERTGTKPRLFVGSFGTVMVTIGAPFTGTIVAPDGLIDLASVPITGPQHAGAFFGKDITIHQDNTVTFIPFTGVPVLNTF